MVSVALSTGITGVAIGQKHMFARELVRHVVVEVHDYADVTTACGNRLEALPRTWQPDRPCKRCAHKWPSFNFFAEIGAPVYGRAFFHDSADERLAAYGRRVIRHCGSKKLAREIAVAIGYENPEDIAVDHPDLREFVTYIRVPKALALTQRQKTLARLAQG